MDFPAILSSLSNWRSSFSKGEEIQNNETAVLPLPRTLGKWSGPVLQQTQSDFFMKLPGEIRNEIYEYAFMPRSTFDIIEDEERMQCATEEVNMEKAAAGDLSDGLEADAKSVHDDGNKGKEDKDENIKEEEKERGKPSPPAHPLSFLRTCRQINMEATVIAFHVHPHLITYKGQLAFYSLRERTARIPQPLFNAITHVAFNIRERWSSLPPGYSDLSELLCNGILLSPKISNITITITSRAESKECFDTEVRKRIEGHFRHGAVSPCDNHVPVWFRTGIAGFQSGRSYVWQKAERWTVTWPFVHVHKHDSYSRESLDASQLCRGDCAAVLVQAATGRTVKVKLQYERDPSTPIKKPPRHALHVQLVPGLEEKLPLELVLGDTGLMYDPGEEYWNKLRKSKGQGVLGMNLGIKEAASLAWRGSTARVSVGRSRWVS